MEKIQVSGAIAPSRRQDVPSNPGRAGGSQGDELLFSGRSSWKSFPTGDVHGISMNLYKIYF